MEIPGFDLDGLYQIETFTDCKAGEIRMATPIVLKIDGSIRDGMAPCRYFASFAVSISGKIAPLNVEIIATDLTDAFSKYREAVAKAIGMLGVEFRGRQMQVSLLTGWEVITVI